MDIAIIGMSALFPGSDSLPAYWQNILKRANFVQEAPAEWVGPYFEPESEELERIYTKKVGLLGDLAKFNPLEFGIPPKSVDGGEPDHFLALKLASDALRDAGFDPATFDGSRTGVILARGATPNRGQATGTQYGLIIDQTMDLIRELLPHLDEDTFSEMRRQLKTDLPDLPKESAPGLVSNVASGRIANRLNLMGPNYMIDAACSSSLIAIELAMKELRSGRCDMMLAGGVQASMPAQIYMLFCRLGALSREGIRPFDSKASGTLLGEGVGFLTLKRLADAERDGDRIYALLKGVGTSSDGKAMGLLTPRFEGQILAVQRAYEETGIDPRTVRLIEAHGTGIPVGDQTEIQTLTHIFGPREPQQPWCAVGSVKSMIGHCIPASGTASVIKMALSLYHKVLPPTLCDEVNPKLGLEKTPFYINTELRPWIHGNADAPRRAGANAFGFGGINAHAILEEYRGTVTEGKQLNTEWPTELCIFSGESHAALLTAIQAVQATLTTAPALANIAQHLSTQSVGNFRLAVVAKDLKDLGDKLIKVTEKLTAGQTIPNRAGIFYGEVTGTPDKMAFLFPGEGSQYPYMLADLCLYFPKVRAWFDFSDESFYGDWEYLPSQVVFTPPTGLTKEERSYLTQQLYTMDMATETIFTSGIALYELLSDFGIKPDVMVGHSTGEHTALVASGVIRQTNRAELLDRKRGLNKMYKDLDATDSIPRGVLLNVGAVPRGFLPELVANSGGELYLAMDNCPNQAILFGQGTVIEQAMTKIRDVGGIFTQLPFDRPYHTPAFGEVETALQKLYAILDVGAAHTPLYSCASTEPFTAVPNEIRALAAKQWATCVRFRETIEKLYDQGIKTFIEVGPSSNLSSFVKDILHGQDYLAIPSNVQRKSGIEQIQSLLARLFIGGTELNFAPLYQYRDIREPKVLDARAITLSQGNQVMNLSMPVMHFEPEFVKMVQAKLQPVTASPAATPPPVAPSPLPSTNGVTPVTAVQPSMTVVSETVIMPARVEAAEVMQPHNLVTETPMTGDGAMQLDVLMGHFSLMQEFLAHQERVNEMFYANLPGEDDAQYEF